MPQRTKVSSGIIAAAGVWLCGLALSVAPARVTDAITNAIRDSLAPGQQWLVDAREFVRPTPSGDIAELERELQHWQTRCRQLEVAVAQAHSRPVDDQREPVSASASSDPLIVPELLEARVLGADRDLLARRFLRFIDRGSDTHVAVDDFVLADDALHIDLGSTSGVVADMPVFAAGVVVGRVQAVGKWTATVQLVTDPGYHAAAQVIRATPEGPVFGAAGILAGGEDGGCRLDLIPATEPVTVGDSVYTDVAATGLEQPMYFGHIVRAELPTGATHWSITVEPALNDETLQRVAVLQELPNPARWPVAQPLAQTDDHRHGR